MGETLRSYDINGQSLTMVALAKAPADLLDPILAPFAVTAGGAPDCRITVQLVETLPPAPRGPFRWQGRLPEGPDASLVHGDGRRILHAQGHYEVSLQDNAKAGTIALRQGSAGLLAATAGFWLLGHILGARGGISSMPPALSKAAPRTPFSYSLPAAPARRPRRWRWHATATGSPATTRPCSSSVPRAHGHGPFRGR
jgi:hypothetical protein